ncbi:hypothetical protein ACFYSJ_39515 [Streptomyces sp. NPDC005248]|uniref:hypothetical protein n=1 Tax=Streptomyces sp. NPDC005248 TaxID=3364709 RepID=UPI00367EDBA3
MSVEVRIDTGKISRLLRLRGGRTARKLAERTQKVARIAEREAPGSMGSYISWKVTDGPKGLQGVIVCDHHAVRFVLDGTRPHIIRPRKKNGVLRFEVGGRVVYSAYVRHPGTRPNNFMARSLREGR